jgi:hypothetical protein
VTADLRRQLIGFERILVNPSDVLPDDAIKIFDPRLQSAPTCSWSTRWWVYRRIEFSVGFATGESLRKDWENVIYCSEKCRRNSHTAKSGREPEPQ